jgi:hypothetical protein
MKRIFTNWMGVAIISVLISNIFTSCDSKNSDNGGETAEGDSIVVSDSVVGNVTWTAENQYYLEGFVYVTSGSVLTIEPGTIIKGDKDTKATLVVERGAKIYAIGTKANPIVFTSAMAVGERGYGDWGGIVLCGYAPVNATAGYQKIEGGPRSLFGGTDASDNSGTLQYVRIEFAGVEYATDNEINGLTLGAVGSGTTIDHIQVSYCGDDSYEWFGGSVNAKYLVAFRGWDDEFDTDNGFSGKLQFLVGLRDPNVADKSKSNGFESDNDASGSSNSPYTNPIFSNVSLFGPYTTLTDVVNPTGGSSTGAFQAAMHLRRNTKLCCYNSVFAGWPKGLFIENGGKGDAQGNATNGELVLSNNIMAGMIANYVEDATATAGFNEAYWTRSTGNNLVLTNNSDLGLSNPFSLTAPKFYATSTSSAVYGKASFTDSNVAVSFFDKVTYVGAFGTEDWTEGWCNFDPQNTEY